MPTSAFQRAAHEGLNQPEGSSGGGKGKGKSRPTNSRRNKRQKTKQKYAKAREDAQLEGIIPTTPEGAVRDERTRSVDPVDGLPQLVREALRDNWATPATAKPAIIAALLRPFFNNLTVLDDEGKPVSVAPPAKLLNELARTIMQLDQRQYERDNPVAAGQAKGASTPVSVSVQANMLAVKVIREAFENETGRGVSGLPAPSEPLPPSHSRFDGEVEAGAASTSYQQHPSESLAHTKQQNEHNCPIPARQEPPV